MLLFGLGNLTYPGTRHSVGQMIIDGLAAKLDIRLAYESKIHTFYGETTRLTLPGAAQVRSLSLAKTKNYMNVSGPAVKATYEQKLHPASVSRGRQMIIIHDSIDHVPMKIAPRFGGSANGHNGIKSVIAAFGTKDFWRIRIGIGMPPRGALEQYVLDRLSPEELRYWQPGGGGIEKVWEAVIKIIEEE
ncbi:hypothetical protein PIIN_04071 [Serendipita indica DSM 11827]|uniref:peptidyl-tRNA hydrolase n=1 Tax=Serendipita indica (strain DSM 11827) TaxID=1109443 RepID=G4TFQ1_SERID|nr:hypothetical protein PIIN_04071 [Serendipita indica DSM 11827]